MGPTWGPSGADRTQVDPMLAPWTLLSGKLTLGKACRERIFKMNNYDKQSKNLHRGVNLKQIVSDLKFAWWHVNEFWHELIIQTWKLYQKRLPWITITKSFIAFSSSKISSHELCPIAGQQGVCLLLTYRCIRIASVYNDWPWAL